MEEKSKKNKNEILINFLLFFLKNSFPFMKFYSFLNNLKKANNIFDIEDYKKIRLKNTVYMWLSAIPYYYLAYKSFNIFLIFNNKVLPKLGSFVLSFDNILILFKVLTPFLLAFLVVLGVTIISSLIINFIVMKTHIKIIEENQIKDLLVRNKFIQKEELSDFFIFSSYEGIYLGHENYSQDDIMSWKKFWEKLNFKVGKIYLSKQDSNLSFYEKKYNLKRSINYVFS